MDPNRYLELLTNSVYTEGGNWTVTLRHPQGIPQALSFIRGAPPHLHRHFNLEIVLLDHIRRNHTFLTIQSNELASIISAATKQQLTSITIRWTNIAGDLTPVIRALEQSRSLQFVEFQDFRIEEGPGFDAQMESLGAAVARLPTIRRVTFELQEDKPEWRIMTGLVRQANFVLERIMLQCLDLSDEGFRRPMQDFLSALTESKTVKQLCMSAEDEGARLGANHIEPLRDLILGNTSLEELTVAVKPHTDQSPLADAMEHNTTLVSVTIDSDDMIPYPKLDFYQTINRYGRGRLLRDVNNTKDWLHAVITAATSKDSIYDPKDPSSVYYLLRNNPALCDLKTGSEVDSGRGTKRKRDDSTSTDGGQSDDILLDEPAPKKRRLV